MNPTLIIAAVSAAIAGSAGFGTAWTLQGRAIDKINLEHSDAIISQQRAARATAERLATQVITAQNAASTRNVTLRRDAAHAADAGSGLRLASASTVRASTKDATSCNAIVSAYGVVLEESIGFVREVAAVADQCISDNQALTDTR